MFTIQVILIIINAIGETVTAGHWKPEEIKLRIGGDRSLPGEIKLADIQYTL